jgi:hypothetical protein
MGLRELPRRRQADATAGPAAKLTGRHVDVHDFVVDGMLHGRVARPPSVGASLRSVDEVSIAHDFIPSDLRISRAALMAAFRLVRAFSARCLLNSS